MGDIGLMKHKVGDKVKIKTWDQMEKEFSLNSALNIDCRRSFTTGMEQIVKKLDTDRILTIKSIDKGNELIYEMEEGKNWHWSDDMIEGLVLINEKIYDEPIESRWQILDL